MEAAPHFLRKQHKYWISRVKKPAATNSSMADQDNRLQVYTKLLDDLVNVNSLFTVAVFIGLGLASSEEGGVRKALVLCEVVSFACFLLSSLLAKSQKIYLNRYSEKEEIFHQDRWPNWRHALRLSALGSFLGVMFLTASMGFVIKIKVGTLGLVIAAIVVLVVIVAIALFVYFVSLLSAVNYLHVNT